MDPAVIIDGVVAAVLLGFLIAGAVRGLFRSVAGLLIVVLSLVGAGYLSQLFTPMLAASVQPYIEQRITEKLDAALTGEGDSGQASSSENAAASSQNSAVQMPEDGDASARSQTPDVQRLLEILGIDADPAGSLARSAQEKVRSAEESAVSAVVDSLAQTVLRAALFTICFCLLMLALKALMHAVDLVLKLPGVHFLNHAGGALIGLAEGALVLFLAIWVLRRLGVSFDTTMAADTVLLRFFTTHTPLSVLSFL